MTKLCLFFALLLVSGAVSAQFYDNFSDNDYTHSPEWTTEPGNFFINASNQLQSANNIANNTFQIYTTSEPASNAQWEFWVRLDLNTSSANYVDVWLISSENNLSSDTNEGYFVRLGTTGDNISLLKKTASGSPVAIISGIKGIFNSSSTTVKIKVIRTSANRWILMRDLTGTGNSYKSEGEISDNEITSSSYFGISIRQSTASFFGKHFFDDFEVKVLESIPANTDIQSIRVINSNSIQIIFDHPLNVSSAEEVFHYHVNTLGIPQNAEVDAIDGSIVTLTFDNGIAPNTLNTILIDGVADVFGNIISDANQPFTYFKPERYDVVINEIFADPSPQIGLPDQKFIELRNNAASPVDLGGWRLVSGARTVVLPSVSLAPDSFLIITSTAGLEEYLPFGETVAVAGFPTLNIGGSEVTLADADGATMHAMRYNLATYKNVVKQEGGFSLELINPKYGCGLEDNWTASNSKLGGTPGRENSVYKMESEVSSLSLSDAYLSAQDTLIIKINRPVDSLTASRPENYHFSPQQSVKTVEVLPPYFDRVKIALSSEVSRNVIYSISVSGLSDCIGNTIDSKTSVEFGLFEEPVAADIVINEILSNPQTAGGEYVELYNNSRNIFDIGSLYLSNRNSAGEIASITRITTEPRSFLPGSFILLTKNRNILINDYPFANAAAVLQMPSMPSFPNDKGSVLLLTLQGEIIDEVDYDKDWHFPLIKDRKGVSLERIDYSGPSEAGNFHSAAANVGYGTPGYKNSQNLANNNTGNVAFSITPQVFSPDNDGIDDYLTINYTFATPGFITNIKIFDASGRMVRYLEKNSISGTKGYYRWDGLDDKRQQLPQGIYLIYFESFDENGQKVKHKKAVTLARRF